MYSLLAQSSSGGSGFVTLLVFALPLGLLFVFMRNQQKRVRNQQALQQAAEVGDEVLTTSGMFGTIVDEDEDEGTIILEIAPGTQIKLIRGAISRVVSDDEQDGDEDDEVVDLADDDQPSPADADNAEGPFRS